MSNQFLNRALANAKIGTNKAADFAREVWKDAGPVQKLGLGMGAAGLTANIVNSAIKTRADAAAAEKRLELDKQNLKALKNIHEALTAGKP